MTIAILGGLDDDHASFMLQHLTQKGQDAILLDSRRFPNELRLTLDPRSDQWTIHLPGGRRVNQGEIRAIYWRCYSGIPHPGLPNEEQAFIAQNDARSLFESFLVTYPTRWVNGWNGYQLHQTKPAALRIASSLGVPVPATCLTNDPQAVQEFAASHPRSIFKPIQGGAHTRPLSPRHLAVENLAHLRFAPVTVQEKIPGTNIRVFVAGEEVLACEVQSESLDFRDTPDPRIIPHDLPDSIAKQSGRIAQELHLIWTGMDFRLTPDGNYVFLEANPSPMFLGFESRSGLPLTDALTRLLIQG